MSEDSTAHNRYSGSIEMLLSDAQGERGGVIAGERGRGAVQHQRGWPAALQGGLGLAWEVAGVLRARAPPGRGAPAGRCPGRYRADRAGQARDHARRPGGADISPSTAPVRPAGAGAPGTGLPEPGLQGAQLRVVCVLAQPVRLLGGQAQRVVGLGGTAGQQLGLGQQPERERAEL